MTEGLSPRGFAPAANPSLVQAQAPRESERAHVIVIGNEKGGSGKSTTALHLAVALLGEGMRVGTVDLDARQGTFTRYVENRKTFADRKGLDLPVPTHRAILASQLSDRNQAEQAEKAELEAALDTLIAAHDFVIVDTPGADSFLSRTAHTWADTLVTPMNDSFVDLDLLARIDPDTLKVVRPSVYAEAVWRQRQVRAMQGGRPVDWLVIRNRLSNLAARNKRDMHSVLQTLSKRIGFRLAAGLNERVIYRELFLKGLTLLDLREFKTGVAMTMSHVAARQEVRDLLVALNLPHLSARLAPAQPEGDTDEANEAPSS
jgi:chromosome partitioning protein